MAVAVDCFICSTAYVNQGAPTTFECDTVRRGRFVGVQLLDASAQLTLCDAAVHGKVVGKY